jgi:hypothetical protein
MRTIRHAMYHLLSLIGMRLVLVGLFGCLSLPAVSIAGVDPIGYEDDRAHWGHRGHWGHRDHWGHWGYRDYRPYGRPRHAMPDRYTIHKGKKCQLRCERVWGTRDYHCREYRC